MNITRNNYELYVIDLLDGKLDADKQQELMLFLTLNPDLEQEVAMLESATLVADEQTLFDEKSSLKKAVLNINPSNISDVLIAKVENDITPTMNAELDEFIKLHPNTQKELNLFLATKSIPDASIVYPNKNELYRKTKVLWLNYLYAAAAILIIALFIPFAMKQFSGNEIQVAFAPKRVYDIPAVKKETVTTEPKNEINNTPKKVVAPEKKTVKTQIEKVRFNKKYVRAQINVPSLATLTLPTIKTTKFDDKAPHQLELPILAISSNNEPTAGDNAQQQKSYLSLKQAGIKSIKDVASEAEIVNGNKIQNYNRLHWTDLAAFVLAKINKQTGSKINIKKQVDDNGNTFAYGLTANGFEFAHK